MVKDQVQSIVNEIAAELVRVESFSKADFMARWTHHPAIFGELLTAAFDQVRKDHGIEFRPGPSGMMRRANFRETMNRSVRRHRKGIKAIQRGIVCAEVAVAMAPTERKEATESRANLQRLQLTAAKVRSSKRLSAFEAPKKRRPRKQVAA